MKLATNNTYAVPHSFMSMTIKMALKMMMNGEYLDALNMCREMYKVDTKNFIVFELYLEIIKSILDQGVKNTLGINSDLDEEILMANLVYHGSIAIHMLNAMLEDESQIHINDISTEALLNVLSVDENLNNYMNSANAITGSIGVTYDGLVSNTRQMLFEVILRRVDELNYEVNS